MKRVHVAVAVIENDCGDVLIARRASHQHMGGLWEFPGGKVETGETVLQALQREIHEEIALTVKAATPMLQIPFHYPDKHVLLDVWRVNDFSGIPRGCEGQPVCWVPRRELSAYEFPPANRAILTALRLPERLLVTGDFENPLQCLQRVETAIRQYGVRAIMLRAHHLDETVYRQLASDLSALCLGCDVRLLLNTAATPMLRGADGLHLSAQRLLSCHERPVTDAQLFGASCHNRQEIAHAIALGVDYLTLSPVLPTRSHPGVAVLGWERFADLLQFCPVPVFALGGVGDADLPRIKALGGFGVAAISAWWPS